MLLKVTILPLKSSYQKWHFVSKWFPMHYKSALLTSLLKLMTTCKAQHFRATSRLCSNIRTIVISKQKHGTSHYIILPKDQTMKDAGSCWKEKSSVNYKSCIKPAFAFASQLRDKGLWGGEQNLKTVLSWSPIYREVWTIHRCQLPVIYINSAAEAWVACIWNLGTHHLLTGSYQPQMPAT